jgi:hypothetical protein
VYKQLEPRIKRWLETNKDQNATDIHQMGHGQERLIFRRETCSITSTSRHKKPPAPSAPPWPSNDSEYTHRLTESKHTAYGNTSNKQGTIDGTNNKRPNTLAQKRQPKPKFPPAAESVAKRTTLRATPEKMKKTTTDMA